MLLTLRDITVRFTEESVLDEVSLSIQEGERLCLVGRNGAGKSTLLKVIAGHLETDSGEREHADTLRIGELAQDIPDEPDATVYEVVTRGLGAIGRRLLEWEVAHERGDAAQLDAVQRVLENAGAWGAKAEVDAVISRMNLDPASRFSELSGGVQRRAMLAEAVVSTPDLLLLDEPTNHLDIAGVTWLEEKLLGMNSTLVFISHDRAFLDRVATRLVEVDRGRLHNWPADYREYRRRKRAALDAESAANREFDKRLAEEEAWIRRGVKARTTRNMGRVRELEEMREEAAARRKYQRRARIRAQFGEASSRRVIQMHKVNASIAGKPILRGFTHRIRRGDVIGVMGPNGSGKTTLLRVLLGMHPPDSGTIKYGENLEIAYFDQNRRNLNLEKPAFWNVSEGADRINFEGKSLHVLGYLKAFLFTPDRARTKTALLSGGERNRLLLAQLFAKPSNVLVLDEPTNDLDIETLELLEQLVDDYPGTIILVSHDRAFVDNVVEGIFLHEGEQGFRYFVGNYADWQRQHGKESAKEPTRENENAVASPPSKSKRQQNKLSYKDQRELDALPERIQSLEADIEALQEEMSASEFFRQPIGAIKAAQARVADTEMSLEAAYDRWVELESLRDAIVEAARGQRA
ncbi:MAG: ATP-binding cassette domain-containing protein [Gammaproteobacteria bacterium]|nr:ATP-binding cassette domain-containing protein [Gammaproteobacteria bacterium]